IVPARCLCYLGGSSFSPKLEIQRLPISRALAERSYSSTSANSLVLRRAVVVLAASSRRCFARSWQSFADILLERSRSSLTTSRLLMFGLDPARRQHEIWQNVPTPN